MEVKTPATEQHIDVGPDFMFPFTVMGGYMGNTAIVYLEYEGQGRHYVTSGVFGGSGELDFCIEMGHPYHSRTSEGEIAGESGHVITRQADPAGQTIDEVSIEVYNNPGTTQAPWNAVAASDLVKQDGSSGGHQGYAKNIGYIGRMGNVYDPNLLVKDEGWKPPDSIVISKQNGTQIDSEGTTQTQTGPCCPCAVAGSRGQTVDGNNANASPQIATSLAVMASRGLPLIFATTHCANERFLGPWGWYRSLGIYRKLLEQDTVAYYGHVSVFRQDATRVSYVKKGGAYESAAGTYDSLEKTGSGWFEKTKEGIYYEYNTHGNLKRVLDPNRNEHYYLYDDNTSSQRLTEIKATKGLRPYFYYEDPGGDESLNTRIALRDPTDSSKNMYIYFKYDVYGYMTKAVGPEGCQWYYEYDRAGGTYNYKGKIKRVTDPDGYSTYYVFDRSG